MTYSTLFSSLSDNARVWIYPVNKNLTASEASEIQQSLAYFIDNWKSHGRTVRAEATILHDTFIAIGAEIPEAEISGCGIDASVHAVESIGNASGFSLLSGLTIFYCDEKGEITHCSRSEFRSRVKQGIITSDTIVFDPSITLLSELKGGAFEVPAGTSWHATVFRIPSETT